MAGRSGSGGIQRGPLVALGVALLLVLALLAPLTLSGVAQEDEPWLYLTERPFEDPVPRWNFTTLAADENETGRDRTASQANVPTFLAEWSWYLPRAPDNWSVEDGDRWEFVLFIEGLDEVFPVPHVSPPNASVPGTYEFTTQVRDADGLHASGSLEVSLLEAESGIQRYTVPATFLDDKTYTADDGSDNLRIDVTVSGRGVDPESPLVLHFGSTEHPSHLSASGYPHEAFRALELDFLTTQKCSELLLQQESCEHLAQEGDEPDQEETPGPTEENSTGQETDSEPETESSPGPGLLVLVAALLLGPRLRHQRRKR